MKAPPDFSRMADQALHFTWKFDAKMVDELTQRKPAPFSRVQYDRVIVTNNRILEYIKSTANPDDVEDCFEQMELLYNGGNISWDQMQAVKDLMGG